jgi:hypothetical protein
MTRKANHIARWMSKFEEAVVKVMPTAAGRIEWNSAKFFFNQGLTAEDAATRYVRTRSDKSGLPPDAPSLCEGAS